VLESDLVRLYPRLYHMAEDGSWPSIQRQGLLSTKALVELFEIEEPLRSQLLQCRRPKSMTITHPAHGTAVIRDQKPLNEKRLAGCLTDMTVPQWLDLLNSRVFFWLQKERLNRLLGAKAYRNSTHTVLVVDTARLLAAHRDKVTLSRLNSGTTAPFAWPRGSDTFSTVVAYQHPHRQRPRKAASDIAELAVDGGIQAITDLVIRVEQRRGQEILEATK
jgi:hypothetical protein